MKIQWLLLFGINLSLSAQVQVLIDMNDKKQTITAMGTCSTGSDDASINDYCTDLVSSCIRMSISSSFTPGLEGIQNDNADPNNLDLTKFSWPQSYLNIASAAKPFNAKILIDAFSPPGWMKDTSSNMSKDPTCYGGRLECGGKLKKDEYDEFGEWALGCMKKFKEQAGYDVYSFSPQNEPEFPEFYSSCVYTADELMKASRVVGERFKKDGTPTKIFHGEILFSQGNVINFFRAVNNDSICKNDVNAFAIHISDPDGLNVGGLGAAYYKLAYNESQRVSPKKEFWLSEDSYHPQTNPTDDGILEACNIYNGLYYGNLTLWTFCGDNTHKFQQPYYVNKQFIRYIRPYSVRLNTSTNDKDILALAFKNDSLSTFSIILINKGAADKTVNVALSGSPGIFDIFCTASDHYCDWIGQTNLTGLELPGKSVTTLINVGTNKLPTITTPDSIIILRNSGAHSYDLTNITDGGEGGQVISVKASNTNGDLNQLSQLSVDYTNPNSTGKLNLTPNSLKTGLSKSVITLEIDDHSTAMNGFYSKKWIGIPLIILPYINSAPNFSDIANQYYSKDKISLPQLISIKNETDGNDGRQKLILSVVSSAPWVVKAETTCLIQLKMTPKAEGTATITVTLQDDGGTYMGGSNTVTKSFEVVVGSGVYSLGKSDERITVFPNPADELITIINEEMEYKSFEIIDLNGTVVSNGLLTDIVNSINIKSLKPNMHFVKLINDKSVKVIKIIVE